MKNTIALNTYLNLFDPFLKMEGVNEICINRPYELWVEQEGDFKLFNLPALSVDFLLQFAGLVGEYNGREISSAHPLLSAVLPDGSRVQFVIEPACEKGSFICAIRRQTAKKILLPAYFQKKKIAHSNRFDHCNELSFEDKFLLETYQQKDYLSFLKQAVLNKKNIVVSGGTSTGKTTFLNALLEFVPLKERLITIETDREVFSSHPNTVHLLTAEGKSIADINMLDLLKVSLRLRPDRILVSELRAEEAFAYLRAINSGHPGSITTLHADSPARCFEQLALMAMQSKTTLTYQELLQYIQSIVDIYPLHFKMRIQANVEFENYL